MKPNFEERKQKRLNRFLDQAEKNDNLSDKLHNRAQNIGFERYREKLNRNNILEKSIEASNKSDYHPDSTGDTENIDTIFPDDLEVQKLAEKIEAMEDWQEFMRKANICIRNNDKQEFLRLSGATEQQWQDLTTPDSTGQVGFSSSQLTSHKKNIKRLIIVYIELRNAVVRTFGEYTIKGVRIVKNVEADRLQLFFQERLDDKIRTRLKKHGFRWSRSEGAWQRPLNYVGLYAAKQFLNEI